ncbi:MAG: UDP-N-acetylmuramoyl-L-alanyl-D-glutamate--2,6-diaminopimelate ligase [Phycisphaerales bacterium]
MRLGDLINGFDIRPAAPIPPTWLDGRICDLTEDSRTVLPGSLYIARPGEKADGRAFIPDAIKAGAAAILLQDSPDAATFLTPRSPCLLAKNLSFAMAQVAERFYGSPSSRLALVGVTGTNGKTTITYLVHQILNSLGIRCGLIGTVAIDDGAEMAPASMTTPPALELSRTLARMLEAGCRAAVLEVSSHSLHQHRVGTLNFDVGVFTNLTGDHLDYHKTMDAYADAKAMLFTMLPGADQGGVAIVNADDPASARMIRHSRAAIWQTSIAAPGRSTGAPLGLGQSAESIRAIVQRTDRFGSDLRVTAPWLGTADAADMRVPLVGQHNVMNALQAASAAAAVVSGAIRKPALASAARPGPLRTPADLLRAVARCAAPPGRLQCLTSPADPISVYVDYAHSDDALRTVLRVLRDAMRSADPSAGSGPALTVVFGCGGDRDATKRPRMGAVAWELADRVCLTSDNPRTEDPMSIIREILSGIPGGAGTPPSDLDSARLIVEPDRERAIVRIIRSARAGDVVLIAGKGHEDYQILPAGPVDSHGRAIRTITRHFDDREVAEAALRLRGITPAPRAR